MRRFRLSLSGLSLIVSIAFGVSAQAFASDLCPTPGELDVYLETALRKENEGQPGRLDLYYKLLKPFDPSKQTLLVINGGPGGNHELVTWFEPLAEEMNVLSFDHRGLGCTKIRSRHDGDFEAGLYSMDRAADDLEALRTSLLGPDGRWFVYGVSYGGMLGQKYVVKYPAGVAGVILDSTFHRSTAIDVARKQYVSLFIDHDPRVRALYDRVVSQYPEAANHLLRRIWDMTYTYEGRVTDIRTLFESVLAAPDADAAKALYTSDIYAGPWSGMSADIICSEIWDGSADPAYADFYFSQFVHSCGPYSPHRRPMDWAEDLRGLRVRTFIWAGAFDPVTPASVMREMHALIPGSLLFENAHAGHGLYFEKQECSLKLMRLFFAAASDEALNAVASDDFCQGAPETEMFFDWKRVSGLKRATF